MSDMRERRELAAYLCGVVIPNVPVAAFDKLHRAAELLLVPVEPSPPRLLSEVERLQAKLERVEKIRDAAMRYIDLSPCDPDITREQWVAWTELREALSGGEARAARDSTEGSDG